MPVANADVDADYAPLQQGEGPVRHLTHFSLAMSASRRFCRWVAWNVDGNGLQQLSRSGIEFKRDPAYRAEYQVDDDLYTNNRLDRGHIARRSDLLWGTREEAQRANTDSFLFTNIAPQLDDFNQSVKHGLWGQLEDAIYEGVSVDDLRLSRRRRPDLQAQRPRVPRRARPPLLLEGDRLRRGRDAQGQGLRAHPGRPRRQARIARPGAVQPLPGGDPRARAR